MIDRNLRDRRILVVEDEYMLAEELRAELIDADAIVIGPAATIENAMDLIATNTEIDGAILDVNLRGTMIFSAADLLHERGVPFLFTTGYDDSVIPSRFANVVRCEKPINMKRLLNTIGLAISV